jgi:phosphatidylinositol-4,5-bisphosphate 4-phosphatase
VRADIHVRPFNFGVNGGAIGEMTKAKISSATPVWRNVMGWGFAMERNNPELAALVGSPDSRRLGGDVQKKLVQLLTQKTQLQRDLAEQRIGTPEERAKAEREIIQLDKDMDKLSGTAEQLKDIWRTGSFISGRQEPYKMVSRLALVSHLMGETPLFNCKSGKDRTGQLDSEVKCLAALTEEKGVPYAPDQGTEEMRQMRSRFTLGSGNLEMQRLNTGLPGYKLKWSEVSGLANMVAEEGLESVYRGGSDYVAT